MKKFWIVLVEGKKIPADGFRPHYSPEDACKEAARLARKERCPVIVLEAIWCVEIESHEAPLKWTELNRGEKYAETENDWEKY